MTSKMYGIHYTESADSLIVTFRYRNPWRSRRRASIIHQLRRAANRPVIWKSRISLFRTSGTEARCSCGANPPSSHSFPHKHEGASACTLSSQAPACKWKHIHSNDVGWTSQMAYPARSKHGKSCLYVAPFVFMHAGHCYRAIPHGHDY